MRQGRSAGSARNSKAEFASLDPERPHFQCLSFVEGIRLCKLIPSRSQHVGRAVIIFPLLQGHAPCSHPQINHLDHDLVGLPMGVAAVQYFLFRLVEEQITFQARHGETGLVPVAVTGSQCLVDDQVPLGCTQAVHLHSQMFTGHHRHGIVERYSIIYDGSGTQNAAGRSLLGVLSI